jgi:hypothetical protein
MSNGDDRRTWGAGCVLLLIGGVLLVACGGGLVLVAGWLYYAQESRRAAIEAQNEAMRMGERPLPPGAHAIAIGPEGELFWDDEPIDMARLKEILANLVPPEERRKTGIVIRPGIGAPQQVVDQVLELSEEYDEIVEPLPMSVLRNAPGPAGENGSPRGRQTK